MCSCQNVGSCKDKPQSLSSLFGNVRMPDECPDPNNPECDIIIIGGGGGFPTTIPTTTMPIPTPTPNPTVALTREVPPTWAQGTWKWTGGNRTLIINHLGYLSLVNNGQVSYGVYGNGLILVDNNISTIVPITGGVQTVNQTTGEISDYLTPVTPPTPTPTPTGTPAPTKPPSVACTADAKICPDGTSVGRDPNNNCNFTPCGDGGVTEPNIIDTVTGNPVILLAGAALVAWFLIRE